MASVWTATDRNLDRQSQVSGTVGMGMAAGAAFDDALAGSATGLLYNLGVDIGLRAAEPVMPKEEAERKVKEAGVQLSIPERGYTPTQLDRLIERKYEENRRKAILSAAPEGIASGLVEFGSGLVGSMIDPLNVATAFIPVVGEARYLQMLKNAASPLGRAGVRAGVGAAEGFVGTLMLEPGVYAARQYFQDDYKVSDSLLNVVFGTALGSAVHTGGGAIADTYRARQGMDQPWKTTDVGERIDTAGRTVAQELEAANAPRVSMEAHEVAFRAELAAALDGRVADPAAVIRQDIDKLKAEAGDLAAAQRLAETDHVEGIRSASERTYSPEGVSGADRAAAAEADEMVKLYGEKDLIDIVNEDTQYHLKAAQDIADQLDVRESLDSDLEAATQSAAESSLFSKAIEAAAVCRMRT